jgi:hypothetical protein
VSYQKNKTMAQSSNKNLRQANKAKKDEFYTQLSDIEKELKYYKKQFKNKVVYCNADDPFESNFFKYFASNFNELGLKKLIATSYAGSPVVGGQLPLFEVEGLKTAKKKEPHKIEINEVKDLDKDGAVNMSDVEWLLKHDKNVAAPLKGDGDFRSEESIEILKEADIVVTNPPFSLFREYVAQLMKYKKEFLILGNSNALTYKEIFKFIKVNKLWLGASIHSGDVEFQVPDDYEIRSKSLRIDKSGKKYVRVPSIRWFTNMDYAQRHEDLILYKKYNTGEYPKYDNYDAINVDVTKDIPMDYKGAMGVPITFMDKYNPDQFKIIGLGISSSGREIGVNPYKKEHKKYRKEVQKRGAVDGDLYMIENGIVKVPYARILIKIRK